jgi:hypothetical protein
MRYLRRVNCCTRLGRIKIDDIRKELKMHPVENKMDEQKQD